VVKVAANRSSKAYSRRNAFRGSARRFLLVCEGQTEKAYFDQLKSVLRGLTVKTLHGHTDPISIVQLAQRYMDGDPRRGIEPDAYDEIWAVFDWDEHTNEVRQAISMARRSQIHVALSNPSFEVWLTWHYDNFMRIGCNQDLAHHALIRRWPEYVKGDNTNFTALFSKHQLFSAMERASQARQRHNAEGREFPENRPSSDVDLLIKNLIESWQIAHPESPFPLL